MLLMPLGPFPRDIWAFGVAPVVVGWIVIAAFDPLQVGSNPITDPWDWYIYLHLYQH